MAMTFRDYQKDGRSWITVMESEYYPDFMDAARQVYGPVLKRFYKLADATEDSAALLRNLMDEPQKIRIQLLRVFRRYVSPDTSVEMLKRKTRVEEVISDFGDRFRPINEVRTAIRQRNEPDDALIVLLYEYQSRGQKGYMLTEGFFAWMKQTFGDSLKLVGPSGAGADILLNKALPDYPMPTPADFIIMTTSGQPLVIGLARYDSDRGGAQEDDRLRGNSDSANTILTYADDKGLSLRVLFVNDGPGLLLGSMWQDYASLEEKWPGRVMVCTLKMLDQRLTLEWITGQNGHEFTATS